MGQFFSFNLNSLEQDFTNNITQVGQQFCVATTNVAEGPTVVIVNGSTIDGNFTGIESEISTDATCLMVSTMEDNVESILTASAEQTNTDQSDLFSGIPKARYQIGINTTSQNLTNNILQMNQALCVASTTKSTSGQYVYISDSEIGGNFLGVSSSTDTTANCAMNNLMKNVTFNQADAKSIQNILDQGMFATLFTSVAGIITGIIVVVLVVGVVLVIASVISGSKGKSNKPKENTPPPPPELTIPITQT